MSPLPYTVLPLWSRFLRSRRIKRFIACGWVLLGLFPLVLVGAVGIAHFFYGVPIRDQDTGQPITAARLLTMILVGTVGGAFWLLMGIFLFRRSLDRASSARGE